MKDFVSRPWVGVLGLVASLSVVCAALVISDVEAEPRQPALKGEGTK